MTTVLLAHKIALRPTFKQARYFRGCSGAARKAYNFGLGRYKEILDAGGRPDHNAIAREFTALKATEFSWCYGFSATATNDAFVNLKEAFVNFFASRKGARKGAKMGFPKFKLASDPKSFTAARVAKEFKISGKRIELPKIGWVKMTEELRFPGVAKRVTISERAGEWFAAILVETPAPKKFMQTEESVGVDLGVKSFAVLSRELDGEKVFSGPKAHKTKLARMRRLSRKLSKRAPKSKNRDKARLKLAKLHAKIADIRRDFLHKLTTKLAKTFKVIGVENLNVKGMSKNRRLARSVMDQGFYLFRQMLGYKTKLYGSAMIEAGRFYPSSKTCSNCGCIKETLKLSEREYRCENCGFVGDRDENAAKNLENLAATSAVSASGEPQKPPRRKARVGKGSMNGEGQTECRA